MALKGRRGLEQRKEGVRGRRGCDHGQRPWGGKTRRTVGDQPTGSWREWNGVLEEWGREVMKAMTAVH